MKENKVEPCASTCNLIARFTSQLKRWWDNVLTEEEKIYIQTNIDERGNQNWVHTLIFPITKHLETQLPSKPVPHKCFKILDVENLETIDGIRMYTFLKTTQDQMLINPIRKKDSFMGYLNP